ncbi:hypothetical protein B0H13DRAFT_1600377 [Mycena leptocephala]|nr:hypothetical protein B0H13DRAFT_1600377 [Mycena leptocephala]
MKTIAFFTALLAGISSVTASSLPLAARAADGLYTVSVDKSGKNVTHFTPLDQIKGHNATHNATHTSRSLERRREACGPGSANVGDSDAAADCLKSSFGDKLSFSASAWTYCVKNNVVAFICPYSGGFKYQADLQGTFDYIKRTCGTSIMGYAQISNGQGDMTAGWAVSSDHFCTKDFHAGE